MWEALLSLCRLGSRDGAVLFGPWRRQVAPLVPASTRLLTALAPPRGYSADFLTPATTALSLPDQTEALRNTPPARLRADLERLTRLHPRRRTPKWFTDLAHGSPRVLDGVAGAVDSYFQACLEPYWSHVRAQVDHDRMRRACLLAEHGWVAVFTSLHPSARWHYPVLELDYPTEHTLDLGGRGLLLQPSFFCQGAPTALAAPELPPVLAYPIEHEFGWGTPAVHSRGERRLAAVLGRTRASLLYAVAEAPASTTDAARRLNVPPPTASRQLTALREAGLVASHRYGNQVLHAVTPLGRALLNDQDR
jgi:DNA-binding transcriptional ArsR family regulator